MPDIARDLRYALRSLRNSPGFTAVAVLTLALGIGANTAVFSLINAVLLRPLPFAQPDRLVLVWESAPFFGVKDSPVAPGNFADWRSRSRTFEEIGAIEEGRFRLTGGGNPEVARGSHVSASLLRALRIRPAMGRIFRDEEDQPGAPKVALIGDGFWRRRFAADSGAVGKSIILNDEKHTVIGVLAPGSEPPAEYSGIQGEIWTPMGGAYSPKELADRGRHNWMVVARLKPGTSLAQANAEMQGIGATLAREYPETNEKVGAFVAPLRDHFVSSRRRIMFLLLGTVAFVLLIACSNVASLLLSRAAAWSKEIAVRTALGAGGWRLARQFLCESLLLSAAGSALGILLALPALRFLARLAPGDMPGMNAVEVDWRVLAFTLVVTVATAVAFGLVPLLQIRRLDVNQALKQNGRGVTGPSSPYRFRAALIWSEVALAFVLLTGAGLLMRTFAQLRSVDIGCRTSNVLTLTIPPSKAHMAPGKMAPYHAEILRRIRAIPGVAEAGFTNHIPLVVKGDISELTAEGHDPRETFNCNLRMAGPGYFKAIGIPLRRGRDIDERDAEDAPRVALINETLARKLWPEQDPVGRRIFLGKRDVRVIGVVGDIRQSGLDVAPTPVFYLPAAQGGPRASSLAIQTTVEPAGIIPAVRRAIWSVDADQPIIELATMEEILDREVFERRLQTALVGAFAALALVLAAIGLYGVLAYQVNQQVPEIGLRMALGAGPRDIARDVVGRGLKLTGIGVALGAAAALAVSRLMTSVLFGVKPSDPATYVVVAVVLLATAVAATYIPARRAMRVDPMTTLREQ